MTENTTAPRFVAAEASYESDGQTFGPLWGVRDNETGLFAPFGGGADLAEYAAQQVAARPDAGWDFLPVVATVEPADAPRYEWTGAIYTEATGESSTAYGAVDNELGRFYPFSDDAADPDAASFVADVEATPGKYVFAAAYTKTN